MTTRTLAFVIVSSCCVITREAEACSTIIEFPSVEFPVDGARDVPTNPQLWLPPDSERDFRADGYVLRSDDGTEIALDVAVIGPAPQLVLIPTEELQPATRYEVFACHPDSGCSFFASSFITGDGPDHAPPPEPEELARDSGRARGACGGRVRWVELEMAFDGMLVIDAGLPELDEELLFGKVDAISVDRDATITVTDELDLQGEHVHARAGAFDQSGNFSGWVELAPLDLAGCSCATRRPQRSGQWLGVGVLLPLVRRRRARMTSNRHAIQGVAP